MNKHQRSAAGMAPHAAARTPIIAPFRDVLGSFAARGALLPIAGIAAILCSRRVINSAGVHGFAVFSIFVALPALFPVSDFGLGASVTDSVARYGMASPETEVVWRAALRRLAYPAFAAATVGCLIGLIGGWSSLLGLPEGHTVELAGVATLAVLGVSIPLGLGQRAQLGAGRQSRATVLLSCGSVLSLAFVVGCGAAGLTDAGELAVAYLLGPVIPQLLLFIWSRTEIEEGRERHARRNARVSAPASLGSNAWPMAVISIALPLAYQSDRLILAHASSLGEVARYSACSTLYFPLLSVILLGSQALWPMFLRVSEKAGIVRTLYRRSFALAGAIGLALAAALVGLGQILISFLSHGQIRVSLALLLAFGALLVMFALHSPSGMLLMDLRGRRIQAVGATLLVLTKLPIGYLVAPTYGAAGLVVTTLLCATTFMVLPALVVSLRRIRRGIY